MKTNKFIAGILSLCLAGGAMSVTQAVLPEYAAAASDEGYTEGTYGELTYQKYDDHVEISDCDASATSIAIPDRIDGLPVTVIGDFAFMRNKELIAVKIPDSVTSIGEDAFYQCEALTSVVIPGSVNVIGRQAFTACIGLTSLTIENGVKDIEYAAFRKTGLTSLSLPDSVISIGNDAFGDTAWFNNQPDGSIYIGKVYYQYKGTMPANTQITVKNGTKGIADNAFSDLTNLKSITLPGSLGLIGTRSFSGCTGLTSITIPDSVTSIEYEAFRECSSLGGAVTLSKNFEILGRDAFYKCSSLDALIFMNPDCDISDSPYNTAFLTEIHGYTGSTAQTYANEYGRTFKALDGIALGDVNDDGTIDARDASLVLSEYALTATGGEGALSAVQEISADVNSDSTVDARDASVILSYYAYTATGGKDSLETFINK